MTRTPEMFRLLPALALMLLSAQAQAFTGPDTPRPHTSSHLIRLSGGGAAITWVFTPIHQLFEEDEGIDMDIFVVGPGKGLANLVNGKADAATAAVPLETMSSLAAEEGVKVDPATLKVFNLGTNRTIVFVNSANQIKKLDRDQIKGLFTGRIANWKDVGGPDMPVTVIWGEQTPGQNAIFAKAFFDGESVTANAVKALNYADISEKISNTPGALGIDPAAFVRGSLRTPETPAVESPIILVTKGEPSADIKKLLNYLGEIEAEMPK